MSPFAETHSDSRPSFFSQIAGQPALLTCVICLLLGSLAVWWRAHLRAEKAQTLAAAEARACLNAIDAQFGRALSAAEMLGGLARQNNGLIPNFQTAAAQLLQANPKLASLELQPGGVVSDIVPRAGHERRIGLNVFNDPEHRLGATFAYQQRAVTVSGPLRLYRGDYGFVVRVPIFVRGRDGRDAFWGFVAVSLRRADLLARAQLQELSSRGFDYNLFVPASAQGNAASVALYGRPSLQDALAPMPALSLPGLTLQLAIEQRGGWTSRTRLVLEWLVVVGLSGLACLLVNLIEVRREIETSLSEANHRVDREVMERKQAQEEFCLVKDASSATQAELKQTRLLLQQTEARRAEFEARLEKATRAAAEAHQAALAAQQQAGQSTTERQAQLEAALSAAEAAARARETELDQARAALAAAQDQIRDFSARLETAVRAQQDTAAAAAAQHEQAQAASAALQERLAAATRDAEVAQAAAAKVQELEQALKTVQARLAEAEQAEAQVKELAGLLQAARSKLESLQTPPPSQPAEAAPASVSTDATPPFTAVSPAVEIPTSAAEPVQAPTEPLAKEPVQEPAAAPAQAPAAEPVKESSPALDSVAPIVEATAAPDPAPAASLQPAESTPPPPLTAEAKPASPAEAEAVAPVAVPEPVPAETLPAATPEPPPAAQPESQAQAAPAQPEGVPAEPAEPKPAKPAKRKKARRDDQIDLFGASSESASQTPPAAAAEASAPAAAPVQAPAPAELELAPAGESPAALPSEPSVPASAAPVSPPALEAPPAAQPVAPPASATPDVAEPKPAPEPKPEETAPAPALELPAIPGLDTAAGLAQAKGDPKLYLKALHHFVEQQSGVPEKIRDALVQGESGAGERLAQTLVGAAEAIGAAALQTSAAKLVAAIRDQADPGGIEFLWAELEKAFRELVTELKPLVKGKEDKAARRSPPPLNPAQLRKALGQIVPLLADQDPGAKDCLKDNRNTFRSAFPPEGYAEFEQMVKSGEFSPALDHLRKAAKRHGIGI